MLPRPLKGPAQKRVSGGGQVYVQVPGDAVPQHCQTVLYGALWIGWTEHRGCVLIKTSRGKS